MKSPRSPNNNGNHVDDNENRSSVPILTPATMLPAASVYGETAPLVTIDTDDDIPYANERTPVLAAATRGRPAAATATVITAEPDQEEDPSPHFRDVPFAVLFLVHLLVMLVAGIFVAPKGHENMHFDFSSLENQMRQDPDVSDKDLQDMHEFFTNVTEYVQVYPLRILLYLVLPCCLLAFGIAFAITVFLVRPFPRHFVYMSLMASVVLITALMLISGLSTGSIGMYMLSGLGMVAVFYYVAVAWKMVPFAAVNLKVALEGMSRNCGMYWVGFLCSELAFVWLVFWLYTLVGVGAYMNQRCQEAHPDVNWDDPLEENDICDPPFSVLLLFLISLYWTSTVIMNTIQVTVAGVMATWCFDKREADSCCSMAIFGSLFRSLTYSFGSICFGSLLQAVVSALRYVAENARQRRWDSNGNGQGCCDSFMLCIMECLLRLVQDLLEYFNQWAYVFVGIYGFSYLESGKRVMELFRARGWTNVITDNLVGYVVNVITLLVGLLTAAAAVGVEHMVSHYALQQAYDDHHHPDDGFDHHAAAASMDSFLGLDTFWASIIGFVIGTYVSSIMMNVIRGAVNTLIVCWADSPEVLESQHPRLTHEMATAWTQVFPEARVLIRPQ